MNTKRFIAQIAVTSCLALSSAFGSYPLEAEGIVVTPETIESVGIKLSFLPSPLKDRLIHLHVKAARRDKGGKPFHKMLLRYQEEGQAAPCMLIPMKIIETEGDFNGEAYVKPSWLKNITISVYYGVPFKDMLTPYVIVPSKFQNRPRTKPSTPTK